MRATWKMPAVAASVLALSFLMSGCAKTEPLDQKTVTAVTSTLETRWAGVTAQNKALTCKAYARSPEKVTERILVAVEAKRGSIDSGKRDQWAALVSDFLAGKCD